MLHDIALTLLEKIGPRTAATLIEALGSASNIFALDEPMLTGMGVSKGIAYSLVANRESALAKAASIVDLCQRSNIAILVHGTAHYPQLLAECPDAPHILYVRGYVDFNSHKFISIVGTRAATQNGVAQTGELVRDIALAYPDAVIVSGLAFGIDKAAHMAALNSRLPTIAVMAGWVDDIVPASHFGLAREILSANGAIVSDMPPGTIIKGSNFLSRNRIIAGLSHATIVVESAAKGGSLVTADIAVSYDRELFALPGRVTDTERQGTNMLIKSSKATLYQDISDLAQTMGWERVAFERQNPSLLPEYLRQSYEAMPDTEPFTLDTLCERLAITISEASSRSLQLEVRGFIKSIQGRMYQKAKF